ncbi:hypothetical protein RvY_01207 [Ramazzottius varieornatus]|uniref:Uncharacterized protein n=1 Tax=Ramazzottius varieornatus TaxID=947166 RepID=A0A1D1UGD8_RAMVA|nr:hypothetical protein RvY_01207 [Ramazzottius varieornatus]
MKGYFVACLLALLMIVSVSAGPNKSKCIREQATIVKGTEKEATQGEVRVLLNRKLPKELVDMIIAAAKKLPQPWKPIGEGLRRRKKTNIQLAKACDTEVIQASGTNLHDPRKRLP